MCLNLGVRGVFKCWVKNASIEGIDLSCCSSRVMGGGGPMGALLAKSTCVGAEREATKVGRKGGYLERNLQAEQLLLSMLAEHSSLSSCATCVPGAVLSNLRPVGNATGEAVTAPFSSCRMSWLLPHPRAADCDSAPEHHEWGQQRRNISAVLTKNQPADTSLEHGRRGESLALQTSLLLPSKYCSQP